MPLIGAIGPSRMLRSSEALDIPRTAPFLRPVEMRFNDDNIATSMPGDDRTEPFEALGFLWSALARRGITLPRGAVVTTGMQMLPVDVYGPSLFRSPVIGR